MPLGPGFWIHEDGRETPTSEHYTHVRAFPTMFGIAPDDPVLHDRDLALTRALEHGWIRVRGPWRQSTVFEFWHYSPSVASRIWQFLVDQKYWPQDRIRLNEVRTSRGVSTSLEGLFVDAEAHLEGRMGRAGTLGAVVGHVGSMATAPTLRGDEAEVLYYMGHALGLGQP